MLFGVVMLYCAPVCVPCLLTFECSYLDHPLLPINEAARTQFEEFDPIRAQRQVRRFQQWDLASEPRDLTKFSGNCASVISCNVKSLLVIWNAEDIMWLTRFPFYLIVCIDSKRPCLLGRKSASLGFTACVNYLCEQVGNRCVIFEPVNKLLYHLWVVINVIWFLSLWTTRSFHLLSG